MAVLLRSCYRSTVADLRAPSKKFCLFMRAAFQKRDIEVSIERLLRKPQVSQELILEVPDGILEEAQAWQQRSLDAVYPVVYLDALFVFVKHEGVAQKRAAYFAFRNWHRRTARAIRPLALKTTKVRSFGFEVLPDLLV